MGKWFKWWPNGKKEEIDPHQDDLIEIDKGSEETQMMQHLKRQLFHAKSGS